MKKVIITLIVVLLMSSIIVLPVSADAYNNGDNWFINMPISQPNCTDEFAYIEVFTHSSENGFSVDTYLIHAVKDLSSTIQTQNPTLVTTVNGRQLSFVTGTSSYYVDIFCVNQLGTLWNIGSTQGSGVVSTTYSAPANIACIKYYGFAVNDASSVINNITNISAVYGNDINSVQYLYDILLAIQSQSNSDVVGAINSASQNEQINADKNASDIQSNADKNTDKITDGWESDADTELKGSDDYANTEKELLDSTDASEDTSKVTDSANSGILRYMSAFTSIANMFADFLQITVPDFGVLVMISLAIGILPLLVGLSINELRARDKFNARQQRQARKIDMHNAKVRSRRG